MNESQTPILQQFEQRAIRAHNWTSFSPEKRGVQIIAEYSEELTADIEELKAQNVSEESITDYVTRYQRYFSSYLGAKSNTFSMMITGGSNFNTRRHEKANRSEERHYEIFREWRQKAKKAITRKAQPEKTFMSEIERYKAELAGMQRNHELMKEGNKRIAKALKSGEDIAEYLKETFGIQPHMIDWTMKLGFGLQNNLANIKRVEERILILERKEEKAATIGSEATQYNGFTVTMNHEADRIQIKHESKPSIEVISHLKRNGFKWSPSFGSWQRQITQNALWSLKHTVLPFLTK